MFQASLIISTNDVKLRMPTTQRTNDYTTPSLALTNGSTFGDFYYYYEGIYILFPSHNKSDFIFLRN